MNTGVANAMKLAAEKTTLDQNVIKLFSHEAVLATLMMYCVEEFQGMTAEYIMKNCFVGRPRVRQIPVDRDVPNVSGVPMFPAEVMADEKTELLNGSALIHGAESVDKTQTEGTVLFDILIHAKVPGTGDMIRLLVNLEIQNDENLKYKVVTRGIYYCTRMISAQKNRTFKGMDYQDIQKVYSIWICPYARSRQNAITSYDIQESVVFGTSDAQKSDYDKLETVVITLNTDGLESENDLIRYLSLLLNREMPLKERQEKLEQDYHIQMTEKMKEDVGKMCNYSDAILRIGEEKGKTQGENLLAALMNKLFSLNRLEDAKRCTTDVEYREKLYKEFQLA